MHVIIEYDGVEHTHPVVYFGGVTKYEQRIYNDRYKEKQAILHKISALRIPYTLSYKYVINNLYKYLCKAENQEPKVLIMI